jgi:hypothetical protein
LRQINRSDPPPPYPTIEQNSSHAQFNGTVIHRDENGTQVRQLVSVRNRGSSSRFKLPQSYRINFLNSQLWNEVSALNLNSQYSYLQVAGSALYLHAGLPASFSKPIRLFINGINQSDSNSPSYGFYACNETIDADFAKRHFPTDSNGNIYKAKRYDLFGADFRYLGNNPDPYRTNHFKQTNEGEDNWSDLIELCRVLDRSSDESYVQDISRILNVRLWMRYFALETLVDNRETNLGNGHMGYGFGDDYYLYFGLADKRAIIIPYDLDTIMGQGDDPGSIQDGLFRATANARIARFIRHPAFAPIYYEELLHHMEHTFAPELFHPILDRSIGGVMAEYQIDSLKKFMADRIKHIRSQIPLQLSVNIVWPEYGGYLHTTNAVISLTGTANVLSCNAIHVNGIQANWIAADGRWSCRGIALRTGLNRLTVECRNDVGTIFETAHFHQD